jgi:hypothetical protein
VYLQTIQLNAYGLLLLIGTGVRGGRHTGRKKRKLRERQRGGGNQRKEGREVVMETCNF